MSIQFLDCTLRDGAHVNSGNFGKSHISNVIRGLSEASVDIVEIGFLRMVNYSPDVTSFPYIEDAYGMLMDMPKCQSEYALMARADEYDVRRLSECNGKIRLIRIAFYYDFLEGAIAFAREVKARGYSFTFNLINTPGCTQQELEKVVGCANELNPYALMIVDTYGVLYPEGLEAITKVYGSKLNPSIRLGLHVHENLSSAFSLVQWFIKNMIGQRDVIVDGSLMGIGRAPGNLCTELISNYLNERYGKNIGLAKILQLIEEDIAPIKKKYKWGYSPEYFLSAKYKVHRSYAEYLSEANYKLERIDQILKRIDSAHASKFYKSYLEELIKKLTASDN